MQIADSPFNRIPVVVFRTSRQTLEEKQKILRILTNEVNIEEVRIDFDDSDKVLRVVTDVKPQFLINVLQTLEIRCTELDNYST